MTSRSRQTNDNQRFAEWGRQYGGAVRGYLLAMVRRMDVAEDLTQEVFCRAWRARRGYREQGNARAYLLRIADRLVCDHHRKSGREVNLDEESWKQVEPAGRVAEPPEKLVREEAGEQLAAAMEKLTAAQRRVLLLRYYGEMSFAEIAETMDCPVNTALSHCRRGLLTLRKILVENAP